MQHRIDAPAMTPICCDQTLTPASAIACANLTAPASAKVPMGSSPPRALILTHATEHVYPFAQHSTVANAAWALSHGHAFVVDRRARAEPPLSVNAAKIAIISDWLGRSPSWVNWLVWLDADAAIVDWAPLSEQDAIRSAIARYAPAQSGKDILICRDSTWSKFNNGVMLFRRTEWTSQFLRLWWADAGLQKGETDTSVFERLYDENQIGVGMRTVAMLPGTFNSESRNPFARSPRAQPVVHLAGNVDDVRVAVFEELRRKVCQAMRGGNRTRDSSARSLVAADVAGLDSAYERASVTAHSSPLPATDDTKLVFRYHSQGVQLAHMWSDQGRISEAESVLREVARRVYEAVPWRLRWPSSVHDANSTKQMPTYQREVHGRGHAGYAAFVWTELGRILSEQQNRREEALVVLQDAMVLGLWQLADTGVDALHNLEHSESLAHALRGAAALTMLGLPSLGKDLAKPVLDSAASGDIARLQYRPTTWSSTRDAGLEFAAVLRHVGRADEAIGFAKLVQVWDRGRHGTSATDLQSKAAPGFAGTSRDVLHMSLRTVAVRAARRVVKDKEISPEWTAEWTRHVSNMALRQL